MRGQGVGLAGAQGEAGQQSEAYAASFVLKLYSIISDPNNASIIGWNQDGETFSVFDKIQLKKELLPKYFKHSNYDSLIRQLNMYGFNRVRAPFKKGFFHEFFIRGREDLLKLVKRKIEKKKSRTDSHRKFQNISQHIESQENIDAPNCLMATLPKNRPCPHPNQFKRACFRSIMENELEEQPVPTTPLKPQPSLSYLIQVSSGGFYNRMALKRPVCSLRLLDTESKPELRLGDPQDENCTVHLKLSDD